MFGSIWALPGPVHLMARIVDFVVVQILCALQMGEKGREDVELYLLVLRQSVAHFGQTPRRAAREDAPAKAVTALGAGKDGARYSSFGCV